MKQKSYQGEGAREGMRDRENKMEEKNRLHLKSISFVNDTAMSVNFHLLNLIRSPLQLIYSAVNVCLLCDNLSTNK